MVNPFKRIKRNEENIFVINPEFDENDYVILRNMDKFVKNNYRYIYKSMKENNFKLYPNEEYPLYVEVIKEHEVIGLLAFNITQNTMFLYNYYILPECYEKGLLFNVFDECEQYFKRELLIFNPNREIIDRLIEDEMAIKINDRFVLSEIPFLILLEPFDKSVNEVSPTFINTDNTKGRKTAVYDLDLCAVVGLNRDDIIFTGKEDVNKDLCCMSVTREDDEAKYDCVTKRQSDPWIKDKSYFKKIYEIMDDFKENNDDDYMTII